MQKIMQWVAVPLMALSLMFVSLTPANALSIENRQHWYGSQSKCYYNYNWWETYILGYRDGWKYGNHNC